ncbi:hypothetical protein LOAG_11713 [Loa loa]|uniref:Uncharacterized protein n=1 Tax=Loa loa TaxID=7209 RepID=A0A1I7VJF7_LOALO|nr:hypothetical protein LOAG_11713 [Loa loa]EFO16790.2 hypothetical protein LOAG_11713 [Loa loa]
MLNIPGPSRTFSEFPSSPVLEKTTRMAIQRDITSTRMTIPRDITTHTAVPRDITTPPTAIKRDITRTPMAIPRDITANPSTETESERYPHHKHSSPSAGFPSAFDLELPTLAIYS